MRLSRRTWWLERQRRSRKALASPQVRKFCATGGPVMCYAYDVVGAVPDDDEEEEERSEWDSDDASSDEEDE